ncbi:MAG TPA: TM2 domain-containing protein [Allosphingosinicella sp.]|nr:TM2 domain-containing protein [Allosphingosinicella sp.]
MSGATFGRKTGGEVATPAADPALAARRAAFLAEERARRDQPPQAREEFGGAQRTPIFVREKSAGTAYLLWFFLCSLSVHRFYLGFSTSAVIQLALMPIGYAMLFAGSDAGLLPILCGSIWMLVDVFLIPSMVRAANGRIRDNAVGTIFA